MQAALKKVEGVSDAKCGKPTSGKATATVTAKDSVKTADLIKALETAGYKAKEAEKKG